MTGVYASSTEVSSDRSRAEIERTLQRYGATAFVSGWDADRAVLGFVVHGRQVRFVLTMPDRSSFSRTPKTRTLRSAAAQREAHEQAIRQRWRALALVIKAKLEAVASGIVEFDEEFLAHIVLAGGQTVGEQVLPRMAVALETGEVPALLPGGAP